MEGGMEDFCTKKVRCLPSAWPGALCAHNRFTVRIGKWMQKLSCYGVATSGAFIGHPVCECPREDYAESPWLNLLQGQGDFRACA